MRHLIDLTTGEYVTEHTVKSRLMELNPNTIYNRVDHLTSDELSNINVGTYTETEQPFVEYGYSVTEGSVDKTDPLNWIQTWDIVEPSLEEAKTHALAMLNGTFDSSLPPVETPDGLLWRPGHSSAAVIRDVAEMAELLGMETVTLTDIHDVEVECSLTEARGISAHIGAAYQTAFLQRAAKRRQITSAETVEAALAVTWDDPS